MTFTWSDFCDIAIFLRDHAGEDGIPEEAAMRCSVSRAYYAAFRHALNSARENGDYEEPDESFKNHTCVRIYYQKRGKPHISTQLYRLHRWRKDADYEEPAYQINTTSVNSAITESQKILQL
jgi:uncharacterized protein (UPF0332 family)